MKTGLPGLIFAVARLLSPWNNITCWAGGLLADKAAGHGAPRLATAKFFGVYCHTALAALSQAKTLKILFEALNGPNGLRIVSNFRKTYILQHWGIKGFHKIEYLGRY